jgi:hypothetical protein
MNAYLAIISLRAVRGYAGRATDMGAARRVD